MLVNEEVCEGVLFWIVMLKGNDCVSYPHGLQPQCGLTV